MVRGELARLGDAEVADQMAAYMKHRSPFYGVPKPGRTAIYKTLVAEFPVRTAAGYEELISVLWAEPEREPKYLALGVARRWEEFHVLAHLPLFTTMIVEGAWWDLVDDIAATMVGATLRSDPPAVWKFIDPMIESDDMWLRRTAIICQLKSKTDTDEERLFDFCERSAHETEFFIRKAIGWSLREYAKTDPDSVAEFVISRREQLSGLSIREATKHIGPLW